MSTVNVTRRAAVLGTLGFGFSASVPCFAAKEKIALDRALRFYTKGPYGAFTGLWYLHLDPRLGLDHVAQEGVDYSVGISIIPERFPSETVIEWRVPTAPPKLAGVYGYLFLNYGNYDDSPVRQPIVSRQINNIGALSTKTTFRYDGERNSSILQEFWLTDRSLQVGDLHGHKICEVGCFLSVSKDTEAYARSCSTVGNFNDGIRNWSVVVDRKIQPNFFMFLPSPSMDVSGDVDWKRMLGFLRDRKLLSGHEWFNGIAVGPEPRIGSGQVTIDSFEVSYSGA